MSWYIIPTVYISDQFRTAVLNGFTIKPPHRLHDSPSSSISVTAPSRSSPQLHRVAVLFVAIGIAVLKIIISSNGHFWSFCMPGPLSFGYLLFYPRTMKIEKPPLESTPGLSMMKLNPREYSKLQPCPWILVLFRLGSICFWIAKYPFQLTSTIPTVHSIP